MQGLSVAVRACTGGEEVTLPAMLPVMSQTPGDSSHSRVSARNSLLAIVAILSGYFFVSMPEDPVAEKKTMQVLSCTSSNSGLASYRAFLNA